MAAPPAITVLHTAGNKPSWRTEAHRYHALNISRDTYLSLRTTFFATDEIDKRRNLQTIVQRRLFAAEVEVWLEHVLTVEERVDIYGEANRGRGYEPGYAVYVVMAYFKGRWMEMVQKEERRLGREERENRDGAAAAEAHVQDLEAGVEGGVVEEAEIEAEAEAAVHGPDAAEQTDEEDDFHVAQQIELDSEAEAEDQIGGEDEYNADPALPSPSAESEIGRFEQDAMSDGSEESDGDISGAEEGAEQSQKRKRLSLSHTPLKRLRIGSPTVASLRMQIQDLLNDAVDLSGADQAMVNVLFAALWAHVAPALPAHVAVAAPVGHSADADDTRHRYANFHVRVRGALPELPSRAPSFQHIWGPGASNSDIVAPFTGFPVFLIATGYSAGGKTYSLLSENHADPPVLAALLQQAVLQQGSPVVATVTTILAKSMTKVVSEVGAAGITLFLQGLQRPGVADDNGINRTSSRKHVLVEVHTLAGGVLFAVLDLCGDETNVVRGGRLQESSNKIAGDLEALRRMVLRCEIRPGGRILGSRECALTFAVGRLLQCFEKVHVVFFCDGLGDQESIARLCGQWVVSA